MKTSLLKIHPARSDAPITPAHVPQQLYNEKVISLADDELLLVQTIRELPEDTAEKVLHWVRQLHDLDKGKQVEWSDEWSAVDLAEATAASLSRLEPKGPQTS